MKFALAAEVGTPADASVGRVEGVGRRLPGAVHAEAGDNLGGVGGAGGLGGPIRGTRRSLGTGRTRRASGSLGTRGAGRTGITLRSLGTGCASCTGITLRSLGAGGTDVALGPLRPRRPRCARQSLWSLGTGLAGFAAHTLEPLRSCKAGCTAGAQWPDSTCLTGHSSGATGTGCSGIALRALGPDLALRALRTGRTDFALRTLSTGRTDLALGSFGADPADQARARTDPVALFVDHGGFADGDGAGVDVLPGDIVRLAGTAGEGHGKEAASQQHLAAVDADAEVKVGKGKDSVGDRGSITQTDHETPVDHRDVRSLFAPNRAVAALTGVQCEGHQHLIVDGPVAQVRQVSLVTEGAGNGSSRSGKKEDRSDEDAESQGQTD